MSPRFDLDPAYAHYGVMGNPIAHSLSPWIHARFAEQTGQPVHYQAYLVEPGELATAVDDFRAAGGLGLNITVPFKQDAWRLAKSLSPRAAQAEAVNALWFDSTGGYCGDNTDGIGLVRDLTDNLGYHLAGARVLILGAGGSVRGILAPILAAAPTLVVIANRTLAKAQDLAAQFAGTVDLRASGYAGLAGQQFDLVINATSSSLRGELPPLPAGLLVPGALCYDLMYGPRDTLFMRWAQDQGARLAVDGLGMLVEQAAEAFAIWRGVRPDTRPVIRGLRAYLAQANPGN